MDNMASVVFKNFGEFTYKYFLLQNSKSIDPIKPVADLGHFLSSYPAANWKFYEFGERDLVDFVSGNLFKKGEVLSIIEFASTNRLYLFEFLQFKLNSYSQERIIFKNGESVIMEYLVFNYEFVFQSIIGFFQSAGAQLQLWENSGFIQSKNGSTFAFIRKEVNIEVWLVYDWNQFFDFIDENKIFNHYD